LIPLLSLVCLLIPLLIYGAVFVKFRTLAVGAPKIVPPPGKPVPREVALDLTVMITDQGFHFKVHPSFRQPWMSAAIDGAGPDIPRTDQGFDFVRLGERLRQIKGEHRGETRIILGAEDHISYDILIKAMDYARGDEAEQLFPNVTLTRGVV
jgi:hypothetical protein